MKLEQLDTLIELQQQSPIRLHHQKYLTSHFFEEEIELLENIDSVIKINKENLNTPLKIVVLGEVKAGKSTLVNSLIGQEVSYTNVLEATATIVEVKYGNEERGEIYFNNGNVVHIEFLNELDDIMDSKRLDNNFFESIEKVVIYTPKNNLKEITIVDTPGLITISKNIEQRTNSYFAKADVILWVLNAHHLGQEDVSDKIEEVMDFGKPMIAVINRVDEINGDESDLLQYVENEMGYMFHRIFTTSAQKACIAIRQGNNSKLIDSKVPELYDYLVYHIEREADLIQLKTCLYSIELQGYQDLKIHQQTYARIKQLLTQFEIDKKELQQFNDSIKQLIRKKIDFWISTEFMDKERELLLDLDNFEQKLKRYLSDEYLMGVVNNKYQELANQILSEWSNYTGALLERGQFELIEFIDIKGLSNVKSTPDENGYIISERIKKGGITAGAFGLGIAGYSALLGPAAASVTLVGALSAVVPPLVIAGSIAGGVFHVWENFNSNKERKKQIRKIIEEVNCKLNVYMSEKVSPQLCEFLYQISDAQYNNNVLMLESIFEQCSLSSQELAMFNEKLKVYYKKLSKYITLDVNDDSVGFFLSQNEKKIKSSMLMIKEDELERLISDQISVQVEKQEEALEALLANQFNVHEIKKEITDELIQNIQSGKVDPYKTKQLKNKEIRKKFIETFSIAESEIDIICPWISYWVLDDLELLKGIEGAIKRGVIIKILYGIRESQGGSRFSNDERQIETIENAKRLSEKFASIGPGKLIVKQGNTHQKILLCDEKYMMAGSFNLLSFKGDYSSYDVRNESMEYMEHSKHILKIRESNFNF